MDTITKTAKAGESLADFLRNNRPEHGNERLPEESLVFAKDAIVTYMSADDDFERPAKAGENLAEFHRNNMPPSAGCDNSWAQDLIFSKDADVTFDICDPSTVTF